MAVNAKGNQERRAQEQKRPGWKGNGFGYSIFNAESPYTSTISARYYKDADTMKKLWYYNGTVIPSYPAEVVDIMEMM